MEAWHCHHQNDLRDVVEAIQISKATVSKIRQNLFFALFYNVAGIPIAARVFAFAGLVLRPELAGIAMALSSISVVTNSLTLRTYRPGKRNWISAVAPIVMAILFISLFISFAKLSSRWMHKGQCRRIPQLCQSKVRSLSMQLLLTAKI